jgi:YD repeat-containing protein
LASSISIVAQQPDTVHYEYDRLNRLTRVTYDGSGASIIYTYDAAGNRTATVVQGTNLAPAITGFYPDSVAAGTHGFTLSVQGNNFINGSVVQWNGVSRATTYFGPYLTIELTDADLATPHSVSVTVVNPAPAGATSGPATFTVTGSSPTPATTSLAANSITTTAAVLNGKVNPHGVATSAWFEWSTDPTLASYYSSSPQSVGAGTADVNIYENLSNLSPNTVYYFRAAASNSAGTTKGSALSFSTSAPAGITNLALNKPATQSSDPGWGGPASKAVDGNTDGNWANGSVTHTGLDAQAWWQVDLGGPQSVQSVEVWNRTDSFGDRLTNFKVLLLDSNQAVVATTIVPGQAGTPSAVAISGTARYVKVQLVGSNYLSLAEVKVWGIPPTNLALNKTAIQSSDPGWGGPASKAVDGNTDGNWANGSVTHTGLDAQAWWQVDLGGPQSVQSVEVWNRTDSFGDRLSNFNVLLLDSNQAVVASATVSGQAGTPSTVAVSGSARYVKVQLNGTNYLSLAEVKVWAAPATPPSNLALNKPATQSSDPGWGGPASKAVDGNIDGDWAHASVSHTDLNPQAWWQVDLGSPQSIQTVDVFNRTDCCSNRLTNFNVILLDANQAVVASVNVPGQAGTPTTVPISGTARYVKVQLVGTNYLSLAEVKVWGTNLALNKTATQSSDPGFGGPPSKAVDGNTSGDWANGSVTHTDLNPQAWWQVDLGTLQPIESVEVWNRTDCCASRLSNFNVILMDANLAVVKSVNVSGQAGTPTTVPISGTARYVKVQLVGTNYLSLAEVKVH